MEQLSVSPVSATENFTYAGFWRRVAASVIDFLVLAVPNYLLALWLGHNPFMPAGAENQEVYVNTYKTLSLIIYWLYMAGMESSVRQATLGKMALGIVVCNPEGGRISFLKATLRFFAKSLSTITMGIGYLMAGFTARRQALHDYIANTLVIQKS